MVKPYVYEWLLMESLLMLFGIVLIYGDYMQEMSIFSVNAKFNPIHVTHTDFLAYNESTALLPSLDLVYFAPVFFENGTLALECDVKLATVRCKCLGRIPAPRVYLTSTRFDSASEQIIYLPGGRWSVTLLKNYFYLFDNTSSLADKLEASSLASRLEVPNSVSTNVPILERLNRLKTINFFLLVSAVALVYVFHLPNYIFIHFRPKDEMCLPWLFGETSSYAKIDRCQSFYLLFEAILSAVFCIHFVLDYVVCILLMRSTSSVMQDIGSVSKGSNLSTFLSFLSRFLNFFVVLCFHWVYAGLVYRLSKRL